MTQWQNIIDQITNQVELLRELGVRRVDIAPELLKKLAEAVPVSGEAVSPQYSAAPTAAPTATTADDAAVRRVDLSENIHKLQAEVTACVKCDIATARTAAPQLGSGNATVPDVMFISDTALIGADLEMLHRMIAAMGYRPDELYLTALCKCTPRNRKPTEGERRTCMSYLRDQIKGVAPKTIVLLGEEATRAIFAASQNVTPQLNHWIKVNNRNIMPIRHPAYLRRFPAAKRDAWVALQKVLHLLGRAPPAGGRS